jgi:hypothetical protein
LITAHCLGFSEEDIVGIYIEDGERCRFGILRGVVQHGAKLGNTRRWRSSTSWPRDSKRKKIKLTFVDGARPRVGRETRKEKKLN